MSDNQYVDECSNTGFACLGRDTRQWRDVPEAKAILGAVNDGKIEEAMRHTDVLMAIHPDFYFSYYWRGALLNDKKQYDKARTILKEGYQRCIRKHDICDMLARTEFDARSLPEAVKWWIRSMVIRVSTDSFEDPDPFLYLSYIARALGLYDVSVKLTSIADRIRSVGLDSHTVTRLASAVRSQGSESMKEAIRLAGSRL